MQKVALYGWDEYLDILKLFLLWIQGMEPWDEALWLSECIFSWLKLFENRFFPGKIFHVLFLHWFLLHLSLPSNELPSKLWFNFFSPRNQSKLPYCFVTISGHEPAGGIRTKCKKSLYEERKMHSSSLEEKMETALAGLVKHGRDS